MAHLFFEVQAILDSDLISKEDKREILLDMRQMILIEKRILARLERMIAEQTCGEQPKNPPRRRKEAPRQGLPAPQQRPPI